MTTATNRRTALVTGSSRGIGREIAVELARRGIGVAVHHPGDDSVRAREVIDEIAGAGGEAFEVCFDVCDSEAVERGLARGFDRDGGLDILVNNAGVCSFADVLGTSVEIWDATMNVNARGVYLASRAFARRLIDRGAPGRVVNVTSISGLLPTDDRQLAYCASKAAANMITKCLARALAPHHITVNAVLPGTVPTDINASALGSPGVREAIIDRTPLGRLGRPRDIAGAVAYLISPEAAWVTGSLLVVDGGFVNGLSPLSP